MTHPGGHPLKFENVEELQVQINLYFDDCDTIKDTRVWSHDEIITMDGKQLCRACGKASATKGCTVVLPESSEANSQELLKAGLALLGEQVSSLPGISTVR